MNFNFNPQTYCFSSSIPDVFEMSDYQGSSVYLAIYLNRSQSPVFSTTLYAHGGKASIYDLRSIIENYMEAKQLVHATCSFRMQVDRNDYTLGEFTLVYCKLQMLRTNCELFLQSHFLTTHAVRLVPHNLHLFLQYFVFPNETGQCATQYVIQRDDKDTPETLTISDTPITAKQFDFCYEEIIEEELLGNLPQGVKGKLLSVTLFRGKRTFTFFVTDEVPTLTLIFQNEFNVSDTLYITAQTKRKVSFDRSFAVCCGESSAYDDNTEIEYESETSSLSYSFARHLTQALQSHKLYLISPELPVGSSILITDIESELSDATNANNHVKFKWKPLRKQVPFTVPRSHNIFNQVYNNTFD